MPKAPSQMGTPRLLSLFRITVKYHTVRAKKNTQVTEIALTLQATLKVRKDTTVFLWRIRGEAIMTIEVSALACQPLLDIIETSPVAIGLTLQMKGDGDVRSLGIRTTPKRAVSTNLRTNSTNMLPHDILARESKTSNTRKTLPPMARITRAIEDLVLGTRTEPPALKTL